MSNELKFLILKELGVLVMFITVSIIGSAIAYFVFPDLTYGIGFVAGCIATNIRYWIDKR